MLEIFKLLLYEFHYNYVIPKYDDKAELMYII